MAYRKIHDDFWTDPDIEELTPEQKFFYLYLITNPSVNQIGLYEFSIKRACFETGYNKDTIEKLISFFEDKGKVTRSNTTREILVVKFWYHNKSNSPKVIKHVEGLMSQVKDISLIGKIYGMDTVSNSIDTTSQEEEEKEEEENNKNTPPSLGEVKSYFQENGYSQKTAIKAFKYYNEPMEERGGRVWKDSNGKTVRSWKQKMRGVWFKSENEAPKHEAISGGTF